MAICHRIFLFEAFFFREQIKQLSDDFLKNNFQSYQAFYYCKAIKLTSGTPAQIAFRFTRGKKHETEEGKKSERRRKIGRIEAG
jgi:hypothetical protein